MKFFINIIVLIFVQQTFSQDVATPVRYTAHNKGKFFIYWGGNRESYSKSDIHFKGQDYDFTLYDVTANDKPKGWHIDYFNPGRMTIPQTNLRIGYYVSDHYNISLGIDHMKYVMDQAQIANISGVIGASYPNFQGTYTQAGNHQIDLTDEKFLTFEHTDGLNYINVEVARVDDMSKYLGITNTDKIQINLTEGVSGGFLYPKTNSKLLEKERHDDFHVSGFGLSAKAGINLTFYEHFFIQGEFKAGYINMSDIRTSPDPNDRAEQSFMFLQRIIVIGGIFQI